MFSQKKKDSRKAQLHPQGSQSHLARANAKKKLLELLEEDDEFEEFEGEGFAATQPVMGGDGGNEEDPSKSLWQNDWDDDLADDNFIAHLRKELKM